jgi:hypothetical protein
MYRAFGLRIASEIALPELEVASRRAPALTIELVRTEAPEPASWFHTWRGTSGAGSRRKRPWLSFARTDAGYFLRFADLADFEVSSAGDRIRCWPAARLPRVTLRHLLLNQVMPLAIGRRGQLVLHASAVHVPRVGAIAFAGPTGSGKSTLAAALGLRGCPTLTDDCLVVAGPARARSILPGYVGVRLWRKTARAMGFAGEAKVTHYTAKRRMGKDDVPFRNRPSQLRAVFALAKWKAGNSECRAVALGPRDRLMALAQYAYILDVGDRQQLARTFEQLSSIVTELPVWRLRLRDAGRKPATMAKMADEVLQLIRSVAVDS